jgi:hypothetical protein
MDPVGRTWYLQLSRGTLAGRMEIGTYHYASGRSVWWERQWICPIDPMSEKDVASSRTRGKPHLKGPATAGVAGPLFALSERI